jgi:hypothetical protein
MEHPWHLVSSDPSMCAKNNGCDLLMPIAGNGHPCIIFFWESTLHSHLLLCMRSNMLTWIHYSYGEIDDSLPSPPLYIDLKTRLNTSTSHSELQPELHNIAPIDQLNGRIDFEKRERRKRRSNEGVLLTSFLSSVLFASPLYTLWFRDQLSSRHCIDELQERLAFLWGEVTRLHLAMIRGVSMVSVYLLESGVLYGSCYYL